MDKIAQCKLCLEKPANMQLDVKKFQPTTAMLQKLFELYNIEAVVDELGNSICDYCMAEVLNMCENLRCWQQAQMQYKVNGVTKEAAFLEFNLNVLIQKDGEEDQEEENHVEQVDASKELYVEEYEFLDDNQSDKESYGTDTKDENIGIAIAAEGFVLGKVAKGHFGAEISCHYCNTQLATIRRLQQHVHKHSSLTYMCRSCGTSFETPTELQQHQIMENHSRPAGDKQDAVDFRCQQCGRVFERLFCLCRHEREVHLNEADYFKCDNCDEVFKYKQIYEKHLKKHLGIAEKPTLRFTCATCNKSFSRRFQLTTHERLHTGEKPHKCDECGRLFAHRGNLVLHKRNLHAGERRFECDMCLARFSTSTHLKKHRMHHQPTNTSNSKRTKLSK
ncbi:zinc finger protein 664 [Scaptodrosophila lebanonensis]|uniref:Zinc finger protein 664 n=1 Tax=Drosophila lebanonensis TaxID=7225 RepID=A0A6J2T7R5_DROLE|nr:zinc finger protein 664 [Scaptodrosophila lebanonensis]